VGSVLELVHPDDVTRASRSLARLLRRPASVARAEVRARRRDGSWRAFEIIGKNLLDDPVVRGIVANFRDITERRKYEERLQRLYERERELREELEEEMSKRVEFTRALAHELKTPLTPVVMSSQILTGKLEDELLLRVAKNIERGASNLNSRIDELLDLARGEVGMLHIRPERVDLLDLLREVVEEVSAVPASRGQRLVSKLPPGMPPALPEVSADRVRVKQVVMNLLNNAFKYTPEGGRITLGARCDDGNVIVEVRDTGSGIEKEELKRLFNPYHRIDSDRERLSGLGLGLALCKTLVELHGGRIWVRSRAGRGSTFGFSLPVAGSCDE
jgi:signal transduction histidine kinase